MADTWPSEIDLAAYVVDIDTAQLKLRVPVPIVLLASDLLRRTPKRVGIRNASELVAALLARASQSTEKQLGDLVGNYRESRVYEILDPASDSGIFQVPPRSEIELS